jgi:hypothetical protein
MLVTLFPTYVKADVQLASEFKNPVKNWSFENRSYGPPYPCWGVYNCSPWQTNKPIGPEGGWRELRGDVNGDRLVDIVDITITALAMGSQPGDGNWNKDADIDGNGLVDIVDTVTAAIDFGKETKSLDGNYSWYTGTGGGHYDMWQYLDSSTQNCIKGKQVTFTFWFLPESVAPDGSQNYARAEIWWWIGVWRHKFGEWVYPNETKWYSASVTADIPSYALDVKVGVYGAGDETHDFRAWIDLASLSITETESDSMLVERPESVFGDVTMNMSMALNLFQSSQFEFPTGSRDCIAFFGFSIAAEIVPYNPSYGVWQCIDYVELSIKLITDGHVNIEDGSVTQSNNANYTTNPDQTAKIENRRIIAAKIATGVIVPLCWFGVAAAFPEIPPISLLMLKILTGQGLSYIMSTWDSTANDPDAYQGETARARCGMGVDWMDPSTAPGVNFANERALFKVEFHKGQTVTIEATAKVKFAVYFPPWSWDDYTLQKTISATFSL